MPHLKHTMSQIHAFDSPINTFCETAWHPFFYHVKKKNISVTLTSDCIICFTTDGVTEMIVTVIWWSHISTKKESWLKVTPSMLAAQPTFLHIIQGRNTNKSRKGISSQHEWSVWTWRPLQLKQFWWMYFLSSRKWTRVHVWLSFCFTHFNVKKK